MEDFRTSPCNLFKGFAPSLSSTVYHKYLLLQLKPFTSCPVYHGQRTKYLIPFCVHEGCYCVPKFVVSYLIKQSRFSIFLDFYILCLNYYNFLEILGLEVNPIFHLKPNDARESKEIISLVFAYS